MRWTLVPTASLLLACSSGYKPCSKAGDTSWLHPLKGDRTCHQRELSDGAIVNHGKYVVRNGRQTLLEGEFFEGKKNGVWTEFNEKGEPVAERYYENGVEKARPLLPSKPASK